jgi:two-component system chemotaxis response regulator CheB
MLTGTLDDGTSGMWMIKRRGGKVIVQEPEEAAYPEMPQNVLKYVGTDHTLPVAEIGSLLGRLVMEEAKDGLNYPEEESGRLAMEDNAFEKGIMHLGEISSFACPDYHEALVSLKEGNRVRYRCHTGHSFTASALLADITETVEDTLWQAMRGLEEITMLLTWVNILWMQGIINLPTDF